jgi:aarF domain-containing kinase
MLDIIFNPETENSNTSWKSSEYKSLVPLGATELHQTAVRSSATMGKLPSRGGDFYGHITLVDAGMVAQLDETESRNFVGLLVAIGEGDGRAAAEVVLGFSSASLTEEFNKDILHQRELFTQDMVAFFSTSCRGYGTGLDFGLVLRGILGILKKHHIRIDANYATLVVNLMCVDSLARRVCPSYNCLDAAKPLLRSYKVLYQDSHGHLNLCNRGKVSRCSGILLLFS